MEEGKQYVEIGEWNFLTGDKLVFSWCNDCKKIKVVLWKAPMNIRIEEGPYAAFVTKWCWEENILHDSCEKCKAHIMCLYKRDILKYEYKKSIKGKYYWNNDYFFRCIYPPVEKTIVTDEKGEKRIIGEIDAVRIFEVGALTTEYRVQWLLNMWLIISDKIPNRAEIYFPDVEEIKKYA